MMKLSISGTAKYAGFKMFYLLKYMQKRDETQVN